MTSREDLGGWGSDPVPPPRQDVTTPPAIDAAEVKRIAVELVANTHEALGRLESVEQSLNEIDAMLAERPAGGSWCWRYLDAYERVALFTELREWVDWMSDRYDVRSIIRPCWFHHGPVVEELTGLYVAWRATFVEVPRAYSDVVVAFHDRWFWPVMRRVREWQWMANCNGVTHKDRSIDMPATNGDDFTRHLHEAMEGITPGEDADAVHAAIEAGEATPLRNPAKDPTTPVFWRGAWWAVLANSPDGLWVPRPQRVAAKLQELYDEAHPQEQSS